MTRAYSTEEKVKKHQGIRSESGSAEENLPGNTEAQCNPGKE